jgi:hypothetical protein
MRNKKGEGGVSWQLLSVVLVVVVLAIAVIGLWLALKGPGGRLIEDNNVALVIQECKVSCLSDIKSDYCERERTVYSEDANLDGERTCSYLEERLEDLDCRIVC